MRFGIHTLDDFDFMGKTVLVRVDINQPIDRKNNTLKSINRIKACLPTISELSDKQAKVVLLAQVILNTRISVPLHLMQKYCQNY